MKKVLFALTSHGKKGTTGQLTGFYLSEAAHPWQVLTQHGLAVDFVSPQGGRPPMDGAENPDAVSQSFLDSPAVMQQLAATPTPEQISTSDYAAILFVGGHGTMWDFPDNAALAQIATSIYAASGVVAAVCHGSAGLINVKRADGRHLVAGKRLAAFTDDEERAVGLDRVVPFLLASKLSAYGAIHVPAPNWQKNVIVDERLVTGQNPASAAGVGHEIARLLST
jgi:putative intracellular protease/amidase